MSDKLEAESPEEVVDLIHLIKKRLNISEHWSRLVNYHRVGLVGLTDDGFRIGLTVRMRVSVVA